MQETDWRKNWVGNETCVCVRWPSPEAEQAHFDYIKANASEVRHFVIENGQTKMPWALYNTIQADLGLSRPHHGNDGHDATRSIAHAKKEDPKAPGGPSFRHRMGGEKFELKPLVGRHILIQTLLISAAGFPIGCELNLDTRNASEISTVCTASGSVSLCPLRKRDEDDADDGSDDDRDPGSAVVNGHDTGQKSGLTPTSQRTSSTYSGSPGRSVSAERVTLPHTRRLSSDELFGSPISLVTGNRVLRGSRTLSSSDKQAPTASTPYRLTIVSYLISHTRFDDGLSRTGTWHAPRHSSWIERNPSNEGTPIRPTRYIRRCVRSASSPSSLPYQIEGVVQRKAVFPSLTIMHGLSKRNRTSTSVTSIAFSSSPWRSER